MFCALTSLRRQLQAEGSVDVFQVAQMTNARRPGAFSQMVSASRGGASGSKGAGLR